MTQATRRKTSTMVLQPLSTTGTQLSGTVLEQRLTDGATPGAVPMIDAGSAGKDKNNNAISTPDFAPAAFRDPASGDAVRLLDIRTQSGRLRHLRSEPPIYPKTPPTT